MTPRDTWKPHRLGDLAQYINGKAFKSEDWGQSGLPIIRIQNLTDKAKPFNHCAKRVEDRYLVNDGDLLVSWSATLGSFVWDRGPAVLNQHIFKVIPDYALIEKEFLHYLILANLRVLAEHTHGIAMKHITKAKFEKIEVSVPPLCEQQRIVARIKACMERVGEIEQLSTQALPEIERIEFAVFQDFLKEGIEEMGWPIETLGSVAISFRYGTSAKAHGQKTGIPVLRMGNIKDGYLDYSNLKFMELQKEELDRYRLHSGDILINRTNSLELVGKAATFQQQYGDWVYASYLVRVQVDPKRALPEFVTATINGSIGRHYVLRTARRAIGMVNLNAREMAGFPLPLPPINRQQEIIDVLRSARSSAVELRSTWKMNEIDFLRESILRKAFAGDL
jgi:type I restriction enzyme S subunit